MKQLQKNSLTMTSGGFVVIVTDVYKYLLIVKISKKIPNYSILQNLSRKNIQKNANMGFKFKHFSWQMTHAGLFQIVYEGEILC